MRMYYGFLNCDFSRYLRVNMSVCIVDFKIVMLAAI